MTNNMVQTHKTLVKTNQTGQEQSFDTVAGWCCVWCGISIMKLPPTAKAHSKMRGNRGTRWCCVWCGISIMKLPTAKAHSKMRGNRGARARHDTPHRRHFEWQLQP